MNKKLRTTLGVAILTLAAGNVHAAVVNSISDGTVVAMPTTNSWGVSGPITQAPGVTWSSDKRSVYGYNNGYGFGDNGDWDSALTMVGLDAPTGTMTYAFANALSAVGGFINYAQFDGQPYEGTPTIAIYDSSNNLLESAVLNFTTSGTNQGFFYGFTWATSAISYFKLSNAYIGLANLTIKEGTPSAVPVPAAAPLMLSALGLFGFARRRKQNA